VRRLDAALSRPPLPSVPDPSDGTEENTMCPECFATIALLVTGAVSTGSVAAASIKLFRNRKIAAKISQATNRKEKGK
jgi:hypothetical protein